MANNNEVKKPGLLGSLKQRDTSSFLDLFSNKSSSVMKSLNESQNTSQKYQVEALKVTSQSLCSIAVSSPESSIEAFKSLERVHEKTLKSLRQESGSSKKALLFTGLALAFGGAAGAYAYNAYNERKKYQALPYNAVDPTLSLPLKHQKTAKQKMFQT